MVVPSADVVFSTSFSPALRSLSGVRLHLRPEFVGGRGENRDMAAFFLPRASDQEQAERLYDALAEFAGCEPAPPGQRVQSIAFTQDGAQWVAEVGEELSGLRTTSPLRRGELIERTETLTSTS